MSKQDDEIVAVQNFGGEDESPIKASEAPSYKLEKKASELARKASDLAVVAKRDLQGTLDRVFDVFESPNFFQVVWVIAFLLSVGIFVLSAILTVENSNSIVGSLSAAAMTLLFIGLVGYAVYRPKSLSFPTVVAATKAAAENKDIIDTDAATKAFLSQSDTPTMSPPTALIVPN